ncbi:hypothetical protein [Pseudofulvimonas gallinarii]|jgi:hypothetical protein|uniref:Tir chaperone family protein CesT n=1 Tax=Pseudofulvimonas gallinarii TaxID=634155 RepID=A0A4R3LK54_9GAMM|nr:hypothetical protein [Pseudofulvimonas gallinarii]TCT00662.1 hypothetical protein EDC25_10226 [Pseudofulvimonas gallinarii]THD12023.1 hypothetical protein B1808_13885 [Pseudofulvimonas gallinarii]
MKTFEDIRAHCQSRWSLKDDDPYLISFDLPVADGVRSQSLFLSELEIEDGRRCVRVSAPVAPLAGADPLRALRFNWEQRVGYLAANDLDGVAYLQLCENRPYNALDAGELDRVITELGALADRIAQVIAARLAEAQ